LANIQSAKKRMRQAEKRRLRNRSVRSAVKTVIGKAQRQIVAGEATNEATVREAIRALDVAARKGVLHPNNAARRKSRLMKKLNQRAAVTA
jgi:small subunit ribosomal protein S20